MQIEENIPVKRGLSPFYGSGVQKAGVYFGKIPLGIYRQRQHCPFHSNGVTVISMMVNL